MLVREGDAEQFADDGERQREGVAGDQIGGPGRRQGVEESVGDPLDAGPHRLDASGGELACDQGAQTRVPGGVGLQHVQPDGVAAVAVPRRGVPYVVAQPGVRQGGAHLVAPEDEPHVPAPGHVDAVDEPLLAQGGVDGVRVGGEVGSRGGEFVERRGGHGGSLPPRMKRGPVPVFSSGTLPHGTGIRVGRHSGRAGAIPGGRANGISAALVSTAADGARPAPVRLGGRGTLYAGRRCRAPRRVSPGGVEDPW